MTTRKQAPKVVYRAYKRWQKTVKMYDWPELDLFVPTICGSDLVLLDRVVSLAAQYQLPLPYPLEVALLTQGKS